MSVQSLHFFSCFAGLYYVWAKSSIPFHVAFLFHVCTVMGWCGQNIHVWAKSAFLIHVWAKSAFLFLRSRLRAHPCLGKVRFCNLRAGRAILSMFGQSPLFFCCVAATCTSMFGQSPLLSVACGSRDLIHVWAKSAFLCLCSGYVHIHVWAKSAFVFLRAVARGLS